jgi:colanic acid/amylovoran biosynthesis glycosyltransferase
MNQSPRVAHFKSPYLGYSETFIHNYISHHHRYEPVVVAAETANLDQFSVNSLMKVPAWWGPAETLRRFLTSKFRRFRVREPLYEQGYAWALRKAQPDVVHAHFGLSGLLMLPVKRRLRIPMIVSYYGIDLSEFPAKHGKNVYSRYGLFREVEGFTVEGSFARRCLVDLGCPDEKITVVHIGVDLNKFEFIPRHRVSEEPVRILFVGRFIEKKGVLDALRAAARLREQAEAFELTLIGDGPQRPAVERMIGELMLGPFVRLLGVARYDEYRRECHRAHFLLAPSITDPVTGATEGGAPTVLLEAQASGLPVVSTLHADIPEVVRDGLSGLLSPERDVEALAANLTTMALHPERWAEMGIAGRCHVEQGYEICQQVAKLETLYDCVIAAR